MGVCRRGRCSPIWLRRWPTGRTVSTGSGSCVGIVSMCSGRRPRRRPCGGWSIRVSTPRTYQRFVAPGLWRGRRRGLPEPRPPAGQALCIDIEATLVIDHSDNKAKAAPTWKKTFGHHPLPAFPDRPQIAGGEALAGLLRAGNAESNTAADHITVLGVRTRAIRTHPRWWCARIRPGPPTALPPPAAIRGRVLLRLPRRCPGPGRRGHPQPRR